MTKVPLKEIYTSSFNGLNTELGHITEFFCSTLKIYHIGWPNIIDELEELKYEESVSSEVVQQLFTILFDQSPTEQDETEKMR
jgi:hypothetical protein